MASTEVFGGAFIALSLYRGYGGACIAKSDSAMVEKLNPKFGTACTGMTFEITQGDSNLFCSVSNFDFRTST